MTVSSDPSISLRVILSPSKDEQQAVSSKKTGIARVGRRVFVFICLLPTVLLHTVPLIEAQQATKIPQVGYLSSSRKSPGLKPFRQGLRELGQKHDQNRGNDPSTSCDYDAAGRKARYCVGYRASRGASV